MDKSKLVHYGTEIAAVIGILTHVNNQNSKLVAQNNKLIGYINDLRNSLHKTQQDLKTLAGHHTDLENLVIQQCSSSDPVKQYTTKDILGKGYRYIKDENNEIRLIKMESPQTSTPVVEEGQNSESPASAAPVCENGVCSMPQVSSSSIAAKSEAPQVSSSSIAAKSEAPQVSSSSIAAKSEAPQVSNQSAPACENGICPIPPVTLQQQNSGSGGSLIDSMFSDVDLKSGPIGTIVDNIPVITQIMSSSKKGKYSLGDLKKNMSKHIEEAELNNALNDELKAELGGDLGGEPDDLDDLDDELKAELGGDLGMELCDLDDELKVELEGGDACSPPDRIDVQSGHEVLRNVDELPPDRIIVQRKDSIAPEDKFFDDIGDDIGDDSGDEDMVCSLKTNLKVDVDELTPKKKPKRKPKRKTKKKRGY